MKTREPLRLETLACEVIRRRQGSGWAAPEEIRDHITGCPVCAAHLADYAKSVQELARAAVPGCEWFEDQLDIEEEDPPPRLEEHVRTCPVCQGRWQTVREATRVVSLGDWIPGCGAIRDALVEGTLATSIFEEHVEHCAICRARLNIGTELEQLRRPEPAGEVRPGPGPVRRTPSGSGMERIPCPDCGHELIVEAAEPGGPLTTYIHPVPLCEAFRRRSRAQNLRRLNGFDLLSSDPSGR